MTTDSSIPGPDEERVGAGTPEAGTSATDPAPGFTRASAAWVATGVALLLLILLIVFVLQNSTKVAVHFLGLDGTIPLGMALLIAAVGGGVMVGIAGVARVTQLRRIARRTRRSPARP
ncbi:lipopolysaccharide assembly protein LapA domain-containing protein [Nocardioides houyundeii]|uniref:lipopolysaccharide assembly protein LapA domain-containing protein n=1 Tax=Nocardioides houyundeii TaxID=2045452 RepID=UPI0018F05676|nr:lipopolysaccharide assembly protein LapA domain-containing protein [Nocardioides houyundeii]